MKSDEAMHDDWLENDMLNAKTVKKRKVDQINCALSSAGPSETKNTLISPRPRNSNSPQKKQLISRMS